MPIFPTDNTIIGSQNTEERIRRIEQRVNNTKDDLTSFFVLGRLRVDRVAPTNSADVQNQDILYDVVLKNDYIYYLINNAGSLEWRRVGLNIF